MEAARRPEEGNSYDRRRNVEIVGPLGYAMLINEPLNWLEVQAAWVKRAGVPLDLMPHEFWWETGLPRFGEEILGKDF